MIRSPRLPPPPAAGPVELRFLELFLLIVVALRFFPHGIVTIWERIKRYLKRWPFAS